MPRLERCGGGGFLGCGYTRITYVKHEGVAVGSAVAGDALLRVVLLLT